jgi:hypothetical protein
MSANTTEKARLRSLALKPSLQWLENLLQEGELPAYGDLGAEPWKEDGLAIDKDSLFNSYMEFCRDHSKRIEAPNVWARELCNTLGDALDFRTPRASRKRQKGAPQIQVRAARSVP